MESHSLIKFTVPESKLPIVIRFMDNGGILVNGVPLNLKRRTGTGRPIFAFKRLRFMDPDNTVLTLDYRKKHTIFYLQHGVCVLGGGIYDQMYIFKVESIVQHMAIKRWVYEYHPKNRQPRRN